MEERRRQGRPFRNPKVYPTLEEAVTHFHPIPFQPCENGYIVNVSLTLLD
jgi:hypothetical protein